MEKKKIEPNWFELKFLLYLLIARCLKKKKSHTYQSSMLLLQSNTNISRSYFTYFYKC